MIRAAINRYSLPALIAIIGCESQESQQARLALEYVQSHPELNPKTRDSIVSGRVMLGMFPDEAYAAAGSFVYEVQNSPQGVFPPDIIFSQREHPSDDIVIKLRFRNKTQFATKENAPFVVVFEHGRAARILSGEEEEAEEALSSTAEMREKQFQDVAISWIADVYTPRELSDHDAEAVIPMLIDLIRKEGRSNTQQTNESEGAAAALGKIGKAAVPALLEALGDDRYRVRQYASMALRYMGPQAEGSIPVLQGLLRSAEVMDRSDAARTLGSIGAAAKPAIADILLLLGEKAVFARCSALIALGGIGDTSGKVMESLSVALNDPEVEVRRQARIALARLRHAKGG